MTPEPWFEFGLVHQSITQFGKERHSYSTEGNNKYQQGGYQHYNQLILKLVEEYQSALEKSTARFSLEVSEEVIRQRQHCSVRFPEGVLQGTEKTRNKEKPTPKKERTT